MKSDPGAQRLARLTSARVGWSLFIAGLFVRLLFVFGTTNSNDMAVFGTIAIDGANGRPLYEDQVFSYPPLVGYVFLAAGKLLSLLGDPILVPIAALRHYSLPGLTSASLVTPATAFLLKAPALIADAALTFALYRAGRIVSTETRARALALAWWLNPLSLLTSSIQASWDAVVALAIISTMLFALDEAWFLAGMVFAAGIFTKLVPVYLVFVLPALATTASVQRAAPERRLAVGALGALVVTAIALWPISAWHEWNEMATAVFTRTGTFALGGVNLFGITQLQEFRPFNDWVSAHRTGYSLLSLGGAFAGCCLAGGLLWSRRDRTLYEYAAAVFAMLASLCLASPITQPTYPLWLIPFGMLLAAGGKRRWLWITASILTIDMVFFLAVRAPQALLEPLCVFYHACDASAFAQQSAAYAQATAFAHDGLQIAIDAVAGECGGVVLSIGLFCAFAELIHRWPIVAPAAPLAALRLRGASFGLAVAIAGVCGLAVQPFPLPRTLAITGDGPNVVVNAANGFHGSVYAAIREGQVPALREIDAYFDPHYPALRGVTPTFAAGFASHLSIEFRRRNIALPIVKIDAPALSELLHSNPSGRCLLVLGGVLPDSVRAKGYDPLHDWLSRGGIVFWAGGPFDLIWAHPIGSSPSGDYGGPDYAAWGTLYGRHGPFPATLNIFYPPIIHAGYAVPAWSNSRIDFDRTTYPLNSGPLAIEGGAPLAYVDDHDNSSVSTLPIGRGTLVFFADAFDDEIRAADIIGQLLYTSEWYEPSKLRFADGTVTAGAPLTIANPRGGARIAIFGDGPSHSPYAQFDAPPRLVLDAAKPATMLRSQGYGGQVHITITTARSSLRNVYVYEDGHHAGGESLPGFRAAVAGSLARSGRLAGAAIRATPIDADGLRSLFERRVRPSSAVVFFDGVLPNTVRSGRVDRLKTWLEAGGVAIWIGGRFDAVYEASDGSAALIGARDEDERRLWPHLYGAGRIFHSVSDSGSFSDPVERATVGQQWWGGDYRTTVDPLDASALGKLGGIPIGIIGASGSSSVSIVPVGKGRLIYFGGPVRDATEASEAIAQLAFSGICDADRLPPASRVSALAVDASMTLPPLGARRRVAAFGTLPGFEPWAVLSP